MLQIITASMRKFLIIVIMILILPLETIEDDEEKNRDMDIIEFVSKFGYPIETHKVTTEDGYILTLFRIPRGHDDFKNVSNKYPVLLVHPLLASAEVYVVLGPKKSLGFVLADEGYDVWILNSRGTWHSKKHTHLNDSQKKFWDFSWHEIGVYDLPASIDYILNITSKPNLHYIGHSQGTTSFFIMGSERPEYNSKIKVSIALAPGAKYKHMKNPILQMISPYYRLLEALAFYLKIYQVPPAFLGEKMIRKLFKIMCLQPDRLSLICTLIAQFYAPLLNMVDIFTILSAVPSSFSIKQPLHYAQSIATGGFQQYDSGPKKNLQKYGAEVPPSYNVKNISCPVAMIWGANDEFTQPEDIDFLREELPNIVDDYRIPWDTFTHSDFLLGDNLDKLYYNHVLKIMDKFKKRNST